MKRGCIVLATLLLILLLGAPPFNIFAGAPQPARNIMAVDLNARSLVAFKSYAFYLNPVNGRLAVWRSDGTTAGTVSLPIQDSVEELVMVNDKLIATASSNVDSGVQLKLLVWDDPLGTPREIAIGSPVAELAPYVLRELTSSRYFATFRLLRGAESIDLWRTDGTAEGTFVLKKTVLRNIVQNFCEGKSSFSNLLFFRSAQTNLANTFCALWVTDGSTAGTRLVADSLLEVGPTLGDIKQLQADLFVLTAKYQDFTGKLLVRPRRNSVTRLPSYLADKVIIADGSRAIYLNSPVDGAMSGLVGEVSSDGQYRELMKSSDFQSLNYLGQAGSRAVFKAEGLLIKIKNNEWTTFSTPGSTWPVASETNELFLQHNTLFMVGHGADSVEKLSTPFEGSISSKIVPLQGTLSFFLSAPLLGLTEPQRFLANLSVGDFCPSDPSKFLPGFCDCGISDQDSDRDGIPDCEDYYPSDPTRSVAESGEPTPVATSAVPHAPTSQPVPTAAPMRPPKPKVSVKKDGHVIIQGKKYARANYIFRVVNSKGKLSAIRSKKPKVKKKLAKGKWNAAYQVKVDAVMSTLSSNVPFKIR